ncbi:MAG: hypothetical protein ACK5PP_12085 [Acidimicrobiales bacterium]
MMRIIVLNRGGCVFAGHLDELRHDRGSVIAARFDAGGVDLISVLADKGIQAAPIPGGVEVTAPAGTGRALAAEVNAAAHASGVVLTELVHHRPSLEDRVLELVSTGAHTS